MAERIEVARQTVREQTELLHREFGRACSSLKADGTRVTPVDLAISENIQQAMAAAFPDDLFFSEESTQIQGPVPVTSRFAWVLDPVDGTNNYAMGVPFCAISLALLEHGLPVYGVVYDLARRVLMHGGPAYGLWNGDLAARVRPEPPHSLSLIGSHSSADPAFAQQGERILAHFKIRELGSATLHLAYVAAGLLDGVVEDNVRIWDIAAACALCLGGGAEVHFLNGDQFPLRQFDLNMTRIRYIAGNAAVCARLKTLIEG
ncbi:MAG: inositol monophosphatase [Opitutaceae bacterium]|nr:inositol monophosphatase [Opitutaceae bacterium]